MTGKAPADFKTGYVALIGAPNVGKSTLLNQILQEKISITAPKPQTTRNRVTGILTEQDFQLIFVDTPGIHRARDKFNRILVDTALATLSEVDVICFLIDPQNSGFDVNELILQSIQSVKTPVILAINKVDTLQQKENLLPIIDNYRGKFSFHAIVPISAKDGVGVGDLVNEVKGLLPKGPPYFPEDYLTEQPERFIAAEMIREKVFRLVHQEIPYAVAVMVEKFTEIPEKNRIDIEATIHVERDTQKAIIIGKNGKMLKEIGQQARRDIETLLGCHIYLGLFVRVQRNWRKDPRALAEFGYRSTR